LNLEYVMMKPAADSRYHVTAYVRCVTGVMYPPSRSDLSFAAGKATTLRETSGPFLGFAGAAVDTQSSRMGEVGREEEEEGTEEEEEEEEEEEGEEEEEEEEEEENSAVLLVASIRSASASHSSCDVLWCCRKRSS
jgi:septum formation inhibitor MinC